MLKITLRVSGWSLRLQALIHSSNSLRCLLYYSDKRRVPFLFPSPGVREPVKSAMTHNLLKTRPSAAADDEICLMFGSLS